MQQHKFRSYEQGMIFALWDSLFGSLPRVLAFVRPHELLAAAKAQEIEIDQSSRSLSALRQFLSLQMPCAIQLAIQHGCELPCVNTTTCSMSLGMRST